MIDRYDVEIAHAVNRATEKHGKMTEDVFKQLSLCQEELGEAAQAANDGDFLKYRDELLDLLAVGRRILEVLPCPD